MNKHFTVKYLAATNNTYLALIDYQQWEPNKTLFLGRIMELFHWPLSTWNKCSLNLNSNQRRYRNHQMKYSLLINLESLSSILFHSKKLKLLTKKLEILHEPPKTRNVFFLNLKSRRMPQRIKEVSNEIV